MGCYGNEFTDSDCMMTRSQLTHISRTILDYNCEWSWRYNVLNLSNDSSKNAPSIREERSIIAVCGLSGVSRT